MINNKMNDNNKNNATPKQDDIGKNKPNDTAGFYFSSSVKIYDPNSNEVLVFKRGDD